MPDFKSRRPDTMAISAENFNGGNALSLTNQPALRSFLETIRDEDTPLTFVLGAGISVDAGFPTWDALVGRLASRITDPVTAELAKVDRADGPMRQAESIFRMLSADNPDTDADQLRTVLYDLMPETKPGPIANMIAEIWATRATRLTLITTNFDDVLEQALENFLGRDLTNVSFSLYEQGESEKDRPEHDADYGGITEWQKALESEADDPVVMHLHGMARRGNFPLRPVILSESHFLWHGPRVRQVVREQLENSVVVFIGVSLNDPNLVGPLWDVSRKYSAIRDSPGRKHRCYVLHVPSAVDGTDQIDVARRYVIRKYEYMEQALGVIPIFFKSYSQLYQALIEAKLALQHDDYFEDTGAASRGYGARFGRRLSTAWENLGWPDGQFDPTAHESRHTTSRELASMLEQHDHPIERVLRHPGSSLVRRHQELKKLYDDYNEQREQFALFVWLRNLTEVDSDLSAPYAITLAASSAYLHHAGWSFDREVLIEPDSPVPVSKAVYSGLLTVENLPPVGRFNVWRGAWAMPLRVSSRHSDDRTDVVTIGAVSLNTTHYVKPSESAKERVSVLAAILESQDRTDRLRDLIELKVADLVGRVEPDRPR